MRLILSARLTKKREVVLLFRIGRRHTLSIIIALLFASAPAATFAQQPRETLFRDVRVLDVVNGRLGAPTSVLVKDNVISAIGTSAKASQDAKIVDGKGRTLMPGLIDVHVHLTFGALPLTGLYDPNTTADQIGAATARSAEEMLLRGFTAVRDMGGPIFPLRQAIDAGKLRGPRIWPSGAVISQTSGHGDFRTPAERSRRFFGKAARAEEEGATFIADGRDEVLTATRENLRMGASQIKIMGGGGTSSAYDPIDVTQYTLDEMKAAVDAASDWNTYVAVHAYTPRAIRRAIEAGVKCIEHGQLLDEATLKLMAQKGVWLSAQNLIPDTPGMTAERRAKRKGVLEGAAFVWQTAKKLGVKMAWGTDILFEPQLNSEQNRLILPLKQWFSAAEILRLVTYDNAQLLALSGPRAPYQGKLGVVEVGALADLILVDGNPLGNIDLIADPEKNFSLIMKDGVIYKGGM
jgi:imidazolonepropionase-like amidohydrolase